MQEIQRRVGFPEIGLTNFTTGCEMCLIILQLLAIERAEGIDLRLCLRMFVFRSHYAAFVRRISLRRCMPLRILVFTVPSGSLSRAAISLWLKPSK